MWVDTSEGKISVSRLLDTWPWANKLWTADWMGPQHSSDIILLMTQRVINFYLFTHNIETIHRDLKLKYKRGLFIFIQITY